MALLAQLFCILLVYISFDLHNSKVHIAEAKPKAIVPVRSDSIVTKFGPELKTPDEEAENMRMENTHEDIQDGQFETDNQKPGFMVSNQRRQLMRLGSYARRVGAGFNGSSGRVASFIETMCDILKSIIPVAAAICQVGQFKFCAATTDGVLGAVGGASGFEQMSGDLGVQD